MKNMLKFVLLAMVVVVMAAGCMAAPQGGMRVYSSEGSLGQYDGIHQWGSAGGRQIQQLGLAAKFKDPTVTSTSKEVLVPGQPAQTVAAPPARPQYCGRSAKAVPRTPPVRQVAVSTPPKKVVLNEETVTSGPQVIGTVGGEGPTTAHSVQTGLALSVPMAAGIATQNLGAPGTNIATNAAGGKGVGKGGSATGGTGGQGGAGGSSSSSAASSAAAAAAAD